LIYEPFEIGASVGRCDINLDHRSSRKKRLALKGYSNLDRQLGKANAHLVSHVVQVVAEAAANCQPQKLAAVEAHAAPTGLAFRAVHHDGVRASPPYAGFGVWDASKLHGHYRHGAPYLRVIGARLNSRCEAAVATNRLTQTARYASADTLVESPGAFWPLTLASCSPSRSTRR
jgi:hypothetical protein